MTLKIPPAINYTNPVVFIPGVWDNRTPNEGTGYCVFEIDWSLYGPNNAVALNLANNVQSPNSMSQIVAMTVDNSDCGADVEFIFPDTQQTITIPAYSPHVDVPVYTRGVFFYVVSSNAESEDVTRFLLHNVLPPPIAVPTSQAQETAVFNNIAAATADTQLIPNTVSGTIENINVYYSFLPNADEGNLMWEIKDGTGKVLLGGQGTQGGGTTPGTNALGASLNNVSLRFQEGLVFDATAGGTFTSGSVVAVNVAYRTP
jgi:hypothetical protein